VQLAFGSRIALRSGIVWSLMIVLSTSQGASASGGLWWPAGVAAGFALDEEGALWAERVAPEGSTIERLSRYITELGGPLGMTLGIAALWSSDPEAGATGLSAVAHAAIATYGLKILTGRARPAHGEAGWFGPTLSDGKHSFPSGHTAVSFALATVVGHKYPEYREEALALAAVVGLTRILLGRHWTSDVMAGAALGVFLGDAVSEGRLGILWEW